MMIIFDESGFGRVLTLGSNDPTILEDVESYCDNYKKCIWRGHDFM